MANLACAAGHGPVEVFAVGTSVDLFYCDSRAPHDAASIDGAYALVPGSIQLYKNPHAALRHVADFESVQSIVFAGPLLDIGLGSELRAKASQIGLKPIFLAADRPGMKWLYEHSEVTILSSTLESLNFGLGEALYFANRVVASPLPVHREIAGELQARPEWLGDEQGKAARRPAVSRSDLESRWRFLAQALMGGA